MFTVSEKKPTTKLTARSAKNAQKTSISLSADLYRAALERVEEEGLKSFSALVERCLAESLRRDLDPRLLEAIRAAVREEIAGSVSEYRKSFDEG